MAISQQQSNVIVSANLQRAKRKIKRRAKKANIQSKDAVMDLARVGHLWAKLKSPYWTGRTRRKIIYRRGKRKHSAVIIAQDSRPERPSFHLPWQMHNNPRVARRIKSGSPVFMVRAKEYVDKVKKNIVKQNIK